MQPVHWPSRPCRGPRSNHILTSHPVRGWRLCRNHAQRRDITVSGALVATPNVGAQNVLQNRTTLNLGYKQDLGDRMGVALQITTPYAANTAYNAAGYPLNGTAATLESRAITALLSYDIGQNAFAYGGLRL